MNANCLIDSNRWWKLRCLAYLLQFWTHLFKNLLRSQRIGNTLIESRRKQLSLYNRMDFATNRNNFPVYPLLDTEIDRPIRQYNGYLKKEICIQEGSRNLELQVVDTKYAFCSTGCKVIGPYHCNYKKTSGIEINGETQQR